MGETTIERDDGCERESENECVRETTSVRERQRVRETTSEGEEE